MSTLGRQAIVVGAGIAGLTAARVLSDHFDRVLLLESDTLPGEPAPRPGTPQAKHAHALLAGGEQTLRSLFPGFHDDLTRAGAVLLRLNADFRQERPGFDPFPQHDIGISIYSASRPLIESLVRKRVASCTNIEFRDRCSVREFVAAPNQASVTAVRCERHGKSENLPADLVVDATSNGQLTLHFLKSVGLPLPEETLIGVDLAYSSGIFEIPPDPPSWKSMVTFPGPGQDSRGAVIFPLENDFWIATLVGRHAEKPPDDEVGFLDHTRKLRTPTAYDALRRAQRHGEIVRCGFHASRRRHFQKLAKFPAGLIPMGDAVCRFNPIYGQGMSVAAQEANLLGRLLAADGIGRDAGLASKFFAEVQSIIDTPWDMAAVPDFIDTRTAGQRPADFEKTLKFMGALIQLSAQDPAINRLVVEVQHLLKPPSVYREPAIARRVEATIAAMPRH